ncbi:MAG: hypothetical protein L6R28_13295 [Planctomycetes bacterium]|nr:hypothetical protein [Planctomycetota bacterium]
MDALLELREGIRACRNHGNAGCAELIAYLDEKAVPGASHPLLFQHVPKARVMIVGSVPGGIGTNTAKANYQNLVNGEYSIGHKSAQGLGVIMRAADKLKGHESSPLLEELPTTPEAQQAHLDARARLGLHVTNIVKCYAPTGWDQEKGGRWPVAADACAERFLKREFELVDPAAVILLGAIVAGWFSRREGWKREKLRIRDWTAQAGPLECFGKPRYVTAWAHPGGQGFWASERKQWPTYAEQLAKFIA